MASEEWLKGFRYANGQLKTRSKSKAQRLDRHRLLTQELLVLLALAYLEDDKRTASKQSHAIERVTEYYGDLYDTGYSVQEVARRLVTRVPAIHDHATLSRMLCEMLGIARLPRPRG